MSPSPTASPRSPVQQDPALCLSHQSRIRSLYGSSSTTDSPTADMMPPLSSPSQDDSDSVQSYDASRSGGVQSMQRSDSITMKSVKFAEDLVTEQLFDPTDHRSDTESEAESVTETRTASQLRQHFERLSVGRDPGKQLHHHSGFLSSNSRGVEGGRADQGGEGGRGRDGGRRKDGGRERVEEGEDVEGEKMDPEDIALKVLADVASQRAEVELMQRQSAAIAQDNTRRLRQHSTFSNQPASSPTSSEKPHHPQNLPLSSTNVHEPGPPRRHPPSPRSLPVHHSLGSGSESRPSRMSASPDLRVTAPPPYTAPPSYSRCSPSPTGQTLVRGDSGGRGSFARQGMQSGENSISSDNSEGADSNLQSSVSSGYHSENSQVLLGASQLGKHQAAADKGVFTQDFVNHSTAGAFAKPPSPSSFSSSFHPPPPPVKPPSPLVRSYAVQNRPESTNSLSSQYSTSSSTRSVIYRPLGEVGGKSRPPPNLSPRSRVSPIIRIPSASPSTQGQGRKKVSFSDSETAGDSCNTSFEDGGGRQGGVEGGYSLSDIDTASDSDTLTRHGKSSSFQRVHPADLSQSKPNSFQPAVSHSSARQSLAAAPAIPPRRPLKGKESIPLHSLSGTAPFPNNNPFYDGSSHTHSSPDVSSAGGFTVNANSEGKSLPTFRHSQGSLTPRMEEDDPHGYGDGVRTNKAVPLFLDKERRSIAKSAVLQSSKCWCLLCELVWSSDEVWVMTISRTCVWVMTISRTSVWVMIISQTSVWGLSISQTSVWVMTISQTSVWVMTISQTSVLSILLVLLPQLLYKQKHW